MNIFIGSNSTDRRLVHFYIISDIFQNKWFQIINSLIKKFPLKFQYGLSCPVNCSLALMDALDQPGCRAQLVMNEVPGIRGNNGILAECIFVIGAHAQLRHTVLVQENDEVVVHSKDIDVRANVVY